MARQTSKKRSGNTSDSGKRGDKATKKRRRKRTGPGGVMRPRPFTVKKSKIQGSGAFATRWIDQGARVIEYVGERISADEADLRYPDDEKQGRHHTFLFSVDEKTVVDAAVGGNEARFINHCCDPNCEAVIENGHIFIETLRDIAPGEELFYDYGFELDAGEKLTRSLKKIYPCNCNSPNCRGTILSKPRP